jgi:hypothetical protein
VVFLHDQHGQAELAAAASSKDKTGLSEEALAMAIALEDAVQKKAAEKSFFSSAEASKVLKNDLIIMLNKNQDNPRELGFLVEPIDDNIYHWQIKLKREGFMPKTGMRKDMQQVYEEFNVDYIELELEFAMDLHPVRCQFRRYARRLLSRCVVRPLATSACARASLPFAVAVSHVPLVLSLSLFLSLPLSLSLSHTSLLISSHLISVFFFFTPSSASTGSRLLNFEFFAPSFKDARSLCLAHHFPTEFPLSIQTSVLHVCSFTRRC